MDYFSYADGLGRAFAGAFEPGSRFGRHLTADSELARTGRIRLSN
jgi:hypothetical protein